MSKIHLTAADQFRLRNVLQAATLAALMDSRRWEPGDLAFQGGTCLHLAHGSARFSEDLDFMVRGGLSLDGLAAEVGRRLRLPPDVPAGLQLSVAPSRSGRNPHAFTVTLSGPDVIGSAKVKIELWQTDAQVLRDIRIMVSTISTGAATTAYVPSETLDEILADKVYALGARERMKPRDVFDVWWLFNRTPVAPTLSSAALVTRLSIYPRGEPRHTAMAWLSNAGLQLGLLRLPATAAGVALDLRRWLPSSWPMTDASAGEMLAVSARELHNGIGIIERVASS